MRRCPRAILLLSSVLAAGCVKDETRDASTSVIDVLSSEAADLASLWSLESLISLIFVVLLMAFIAKAVSFGVRLAWRLGLDSDRRLSMWEQVVRIGLILAIIGLMGQAVAKVAPLAFSLAAVLLLAVAGFIAAPHVHAAIVGASLTLQRKLRIGDRIEVAGQIGIVREIGLTQVEIRKPDGSSVLLPNQLLGNHSVTIARVHNSLPVTVTASLHHSVTPEDLERARRVGLLCPYRAAGSMVMVETGKERSELVLVIQVWSERASRSAAAQLSATLTQYLESTSVTPAPRRA